jgi:hypothetical protein
MNEYTPLIVASLALAAYLVRRWTPKTGWLHTGGGMFLLTSLGTLLGGVAQAIQAGGLSKATIIGAIAGGISSLAGAANPSIDARAAAKTAILLLALGVLPSCAVLKQCELNKLPQEEQAVMVAVTQIALTAGADWEQQLIALGAEIGVAQIDCIVQAVESYLVGKMPPNASADPRLVAAIDRLQTWLAKHPAKACREIKVVFNTSPLVG